MSQKTKIEYWKFGHYLIIGAWSLVIKNKRRGILTSPLVGCLMVPKGGFEPPRGLPTTPSRWRVYQFHHFGKMEITPKALFLWLRFRYPRLNRHL
jgi:hypothetical protein